MPTKGKPNGGLSAYIASTGQLPDDILLGHVVMFRIGDGAYDRNALEKEMDRLDLNTGLLPAPNKEVDAWRKATSAFTDREYLIQGVAGTETAKLLIRDTYSDASQLHRSLIREVHDASGKKLDYGQVGETVFYRTTTHGGKAVPGTARMRVNLHGNALRQNEVDVLRQISQEIESAYDRHVAFIDGQKVRGMVRGYLGHLNAVALKDSVYFVHVDRREELAKVQELVKYLDTQATIGCKMNLIPLVDLEEQRQMVIAAHEDEATKALAEVVADIQTLRGSRAKITQAAYVKIKERYNEITRQTAEYATKLNVKATRVGDASEIALEALGELQVKFVADNDL